MITAERLRELLDYDPVTGLFTRKIARGSAKVGDVAGHLHPKGYLLVCVDYVLYSAHRLAWLHVHGKWPDGPLDHKDTIRHHNWIDNLRPATGTQNQANTGRRRDNTSGFKGVSYRRVERAWRAEIRKNGRTFHLGYFPTPEAAHLAYVAAATELFGEFARSA